MNNFKHFFESPNRITEALSLAVTHLVNLFAEDHRSTVAGSVSVWQGQHPKSSEFFQWLQSLGISAHSGMQLPNFADGGMGRAYFVGSSVVKFTSDGDEFRIAKMLAGSGGPARVLGVFAVSPGLFAVAQEFVKTGTNIPAKLRLAADVLQGGYIDEHPETEKSGLPRDEKTKLTIAKSLAAEYAKGDEEIVHYILLVMNTLNALYDKTGFMHDDAGPTNIGVAKDGGVVVTDLGPNRKRVKRGPPVVPPRRPVGDPMKRIAQIRR